MWNPTIIGLNEILKNVNYLVTFLMFFYLYIVCLHHFLHNNCIHWPFYHSNLKVPLKLNYLCFLNFISFILQFCRQSTKHLIQSILYLSFIINILILYYNFVILDKLYINLIIWYCRKIYLMLILLSMSSIVNKKPIKMCFDIYLNIN